ncbi:P-type conjugative transfer protein TrbG [Geomonas anaerohicana]|uniref:P-type conjugative transfer protein TrbG n=1 Tax=Geomonas anaerohicana TaxID=2798583 RepID=A0ABS0YCA5_9BACT|nr:P-type conjugative transfer protein TrbG [Geomonas anaerohicana]MBJ6749930.1 P-type conjugative transfer protein TrbG [Geomonas anaerohicana]
MKRMLSAFLLVLLPATLLAGPPPARTDVVPAIPGTAPVQPSPPQTVPQPQAQAEAPQPVQPKGIRIKKQQAKKPVRKEGLSDRQIVEHRVKQSVQRPVNAMSVESKTIYSYVPDAIYMIYAALNHVVDIQLQPGERLTGKIVAGDTFRWEVGTVEDGSGSNVTTHVLIKPKQAGIETNFLIVTDRHSYRLYAQSNDDFFIPTVGWSYSDEEMTTKSAQIRKEQQRLDGMVAAPAIIAANLNFKYKIKADRKYPWVPLRAFDDGSKTYIQMSPEMKSSEAPVLFIKDGKKLNLVNYRIKGDYFIVDRLFEEGELRSGKKDRVRIIRQTPWFSSGNNYPESGKGGR